MNNKKIIIIFTVVLLILSFIVADKGNETQNIPPFSVEVSSQVGSEEIPCWNNGNDEYFVFLPSYADLSKTKISINIENSVVVDSIDIKDEMSCKEFEIGQTYNLSYYAFAKKHSGKLTFLRSDNVATMYIDTKSGSMDYIHSDIENEETGKIRIYDAYGKVAYSGDVTSFKGRGNYTWDGFDKKPYNIRLMENADLLGMGLAQNWVLLANADDSSNLRNKLIYDFARESGLLYSPDSQWVDLYLNGEYVGLYLLCERNEVNSQRVDISKTDGFLVSLELEDRLMDKKHTYIKTQSGQPLRIHYPLESNSDNLTQISELWQSAENAIISEDGIDPKTGKDWTELIDLESWAKKYLIEEVFGNYDAGFISQFFYCDNTSNGGKIYAGPVWDYDHAIGTRTLWPLENPHTIFANRLEVKNGVFTPWFYSLYQKEEFYTQVIQLYSNNFLPKIANLLNGGIDRYSEHIKTASRLNKIRWFPNETQDIYEEAEYICDYLKDRIDFLSNMWCNSAEYCIVRADSDQGLYYVYLAVEKGQCLEKLPSVGDNEFSELVGWYYTDTNEPFDSSKPIYEDTEIYAKWQDSSYKKTEQIIKLIPLAVIAVLFIILFVIEVKRIKRKG